MDEFGYLPFGLGALVLVVRVRERGQECLGENAIVDLAGPDRLQEIAESLPGVGVGQRIVEQRTARVELFGEHLRDQCLFAGEAAEQRGDTDSRATGDGAHGHIDSALREHLTGGGDNTIAVERGVGSQAYLSPSVAHDSHFLDKRALIQLRRYRVNMKILMFGRGTIALLYGWALEKAGHQVEFYVRPWRAAEYGPIVHLDIRDGRARSNGVPVNEQWPITMREDLDGGHDYDLIMVSVNPDQVDGVVDFLRTRVGEATVLMFSNMWADPAAAVSALPSEQVVWGFPGAGGGVSGSSLRGGLLKTVFLGTCDNSNRTTRYRQVRELFRAAGFSVSEKRDFRDWLWFHYILDAGLLAEVLRVGGITDYLRSRKNLTNSVFLVREMRSVIRAKGGRRGLVGVLVSILPAGLLGFVAHKVLNGDNMAHFVLMQLEDSYPTNYHLTSLYARDVLAEARKLGVSLPRLAALEPAFAAR